MSFIRDHFSIKNYRGTIPSRKERWTESLIRFQMKLLNEIIMQEFTFKYSINSNFLWFVRRRIFYYNLLHATILKYNLSLNESVIEIKFWMRNTLFLSFACYLSLWNFNISYSSKILFTNIDSLFTVNLLINYYITFSEPPKFSLSFWNNFTLLAIVTKLPLLFCVNSSPQPWLINQSPKSMNPKQSVTRFRIHRFFNPSLVRIVHAVRPGFRHSDHGRRPPFI